MRDGSKKTESIETSRKSVLVTYDLALFSRNRLQYNTKIDHYIINEGKSIYNILILYLLKQFII